MTEAELFARLLPAWAGLAAVIFVVLLFRRAPYGRHATTTAGPTLDARWGWVLMEAASPALMALTFVTGRHRGEPWAWLFLALWLAHYVNRAFVQPFRWRAAPTPMPWAIALSGAGFNLVNGYTNGRWLFELTPGYAPGWFTGARFIVGVALFVVGMAVNLHADATLRALRGDGERGYKIPHGGLYRWVSCPNYLGEMVEWAGFALCTWSPAAAAFAMWTVANLLPRALAHHRWYRGRFAEYPAGRRAVIPFVL
ncbi:MAG: DUF1295 domain-containing protein [Polyangiales bacterium]